MAEIGQLETALKNADKAGDVDAARMLAAEIMKMRGASQPSTTMDMAKSAGVGLAEGAIGLAGLPGTITNLAKKASDYVADKVLPMTDAQKAKMNELRGQGVSAPGSEQIKKAVEGVTGEFYKPQTTAGEYAKTMGEFAPGILGGGGGLATRAITQVAAPALASETAGQATKGTAYEPYARVAGALAGGLGASTIASGFTPSRAPSRDALFDEASKLYKSPEVESLRIKPVAADVFVNQVKKNLLADKVDEVAAPTVSKLLENLRKPRFDAEHTVSDFDLLRQSLKDVPYNEARAAGIVRSNIDKYLGNIPASNVAAGDSAAANKALTSARGNYAAASRSETIADALGRAENQSGSTYSGGNLNNATRQQLRPILNEKTGVSLKKKAFEDFIPEEVNQLRRAVNGTFVGNTARYIGKQANKIPIPFAGDILGGGIAKAIGNRSTKNQAKILDELLRSRSPLAQSTGAVATKRMDPQVSAIVSALLSGQASNMTVPAMLKPLVGGN